MQWPKKKTKVQTIVDKTLDKKNQKIEQHESTATREEW